MAREDQHESAIAAEKLALIKSPLISSDSSIDGLPTRSPTAPDLSLFGNRYEDDCPQFQKHEDASLLELFYDLFFAANYTVFCETQGVNSHERFKAYMKSILWITWLATSLYDVRFVTDSLFERAARGIHLGVMVGFAVVAPRFTPHDQNMKTMRTMSIILMVSRLCLAVEYGSILWHVRKYKKQVLPMMLQIGLNFALAMIYLGITFRFTDHNSNVFMSWYVLAGVEVILTFAIAYIFPVLSFQGTHLMKRIGLLTVIIVGDGIITISKSVVTIVESPDAWNAQTIGIVTAAATTIYAVFLIYFDWMKNPYLPKFRQQLWTLLHYPLHLALCLFIQGFTQLVIWTKIFDVFKHLNSSSVLLDNTSLMAKATTKMIVEELQKVVTKFFETYTPQYITTLNTADAALKNISTINDTSWPQVVKYSDTNLDKDFPDQNDYQTFVDAMIGLMSAMENALLETFKINLAKEVDDENKSKGIQQTDSGFESELNDKMWIRFQLIFNYTYIVAGISRILMVSLAVISRTKPWSKWATTRHILFTLLGLGTSLVALIRYSATRSADYQQSSWMLPTITIVWLVVLVLTRIRNPPPLFFKGKGQTVYKGAPSTQVRSSV
ncbi:bacterial low temperature requirement a [Fusarium agapanthi]|uniref:Bacterial low temperature requirement a n=1 Tax=Fusarium agapanthi TaxID=1803897 RepID=A0A9P5E7U9_9HYPO|nr:bacterial low temperature requirement a [Fusarium agapanthi]